MPITPSVFRAIRKNDIHQRPFKAYKNYIVTDEGAVAEKYGVQKASHKRVAPHVGDNSYNYPVNSTDGTNQHVVWKWIDHRYYRYPYDQTRCVELTNNNVVEKYYFMTSSIVTIPYHQMGERVKAGSLRFMSFINSSSTNLSNAAFSVTGSDDGYGNLRDPYIITSSMASSSNLQFYLHFNNEFRRFDDNYGRVKSADTILYKLKGRETVAEISNVEIQNGVNVKVSNSVYAPSGLSGYFTGSLNSFIKLNDAQIFEQFQRCDQWMLSFWIKPNDLTSTGSILSKFANIREQYYDNLYKMVKFRTVNKPIPAPGGDFTKKRTPFHISLIGDQLHFQSSDGLNELHLSASVELKGDWAHVAIANSASLCQIYINGAQTGSVGSIHIESTINSSNVLIGVDTLDTGSNYYNFNGNIAELRMYDYRPNDSVITSLANNDFYTGSLYQTNVFGNVFYRNGQVVMSSPMPKYHDVLFTGSAASPNEFKTTFKGQHTIYENEVMVRIPKNAFNVSVNPSAVFRPASGVNNACNDAGSGAEMFLRPGDYRKTMFISGTAYPYVTTVGLYNEQLQLLAVGKLAEPLQKRDDIDMNIVIRWDY